MKKAKEADRDELRAEYKLSDFPGGFVRGKYASRIPKGYRAEEMDWGTPVGQEVW